MAVFRLLSITRSLKKCNRYVWVSAKFSSWQLRMSVFVGENILYGIFVDVVHMIGNVGT